MPTKRKLADLYVRGTKLTIDDGAGGIEVWLQKLNPVEQEKCVRKANAKRAQIMAESRDETSELYLSVMGEIENLDHDGLLDSVSDHEVGKRVSSIEAELETEDEWAKENYLQGLYDAWNDGLRQRYAEDPEDEEAARVYSEMDRWLTAIQERVEKERKRVRRELSETRSDEQLRKTAVENAVLERVDIEWMSEYRRCQVWLSVRDPQNHRAFMFNGRAEVDELAQETLIELIKAYNEMEVDVVEGKGSGVTQDSSSSSEPSPTAAAPSSSSPEAPTA